MISILLELSTFPADWPELEWFTLPAYVGDSFDIGPGAPNDSYQYATLLSIPIVPLSRGNISISSPSMHDQPLINPNWLTSETDIEVAIGGFRRARQILEAPVMKGVTIGPEYYPGPNVTTNAEILSFIKTTFNTLYHASSTCKMGKPHDELAVVDSRARVYGTKNRESLQQGPTMTNRSGAYQLRLVRVVDASAFPFLPPGKHDPCPECSELNV